ncbi:globin-coupled sensor protein [Nguyenibacter vanlangensis]|uniref:Globin-coupled sensor protein n=1 Tax=Nguyenibacter vanlangensis TaxID=1216886 RepID=A0A7Y7IU56_9PROT|nr:globin-coupled sensor protein [Nguyenibacter vanlangensis]NVN09856.1 globin-coupled sensor protein [Nguyenibacter vanlangensis]
MKNPDAGAGGASPRSIADRLAFLRIGNRESRILSEMRSGLGDVLQASLDDFYDRVKQTPELARFFQGDHQMGAARSHQLAHWNTILSGRFGPDYVQAVTRIGGTHAVIGLEPRWYLAGYAVLLDGIVRRMIDAEFSRRPRGQAAFSRLFGRPSPAAEPQDAALLGEKIGTLIRVAMLDMDLALSTYLLRLEETNRKAEREQAALGEIARALEQVAGGDLSTTLDRTVMEKSPLLASVFARLKDGLGGIASEIRRASALVRESAASISKDSARILSQSDAQVGSIRRITGATAALEESLSDVAEQTEAAGVAVRTCVAAAALGDGNIRRVRETMTDIRQAGETISELVGTIQDIAVQTNLLALNANVEASRAGSAGRGFAVVATAIRELSAKTTEAARQIAASARQSETVIRNGDRAVSQMTDALREIGTSITVVRDAVARINTEIGNQENSVRSTHREAAELRDISEKTSAMTRHASDDCTALTQRSDKMMELVSNFRLS